MTFVVYETDESFTYGDFPYATHIQYDPHGFEIEWSPFKGYLIETLRGFGEFFGITDEVHTVPELIQYIDSIKDEIEDTTELSLKENIEVFETLKKELQEAA